MTTHPTHLSLDKLIKTELPPLPGNVARVTALLADYNAPQRRVAEAISLDPVLTSRILRLANSPIYTLQGTVTNLATAVLTVGNNSISEMLMISGISDSFGRKVLMSAAGKDVWLHLIATAMAARAVCQAAGMRGADDAFSCGLLHDIGKLIMLKADADFYTRLMEEAGDESELIAAEHEILGFDHAQLGADAAISWKLPPEVCHMIRFHHEPGKATGGVAMAHILNIADSFVTLKMEGADMDDFLRLESVQNFGMDASTFDTIWDAVSPRLDVVVEMYV